MLDFEHLVGSPAVAVQGSCMRFPIVLTPGEDGWIVAECPVIPGCISQGRTRGEALDNIREAIELCLETGALPALGRAL